MRSLTTTLTLLLASFLILFTTTTKAQTATSSASTLIPTGISTGCSTFMTNLNADSSIKTCTSPLLSATEYYVNATSQGKTKSESTLQETLTRLCASNTGCDSSIIRSYLSQFWVNCHDEITAKNKGVQDVYDVLYLINPFREAICSKDDDGNFCLTTVATTTTTSSKRDLTVDDEHWALRRAHAEEILARQTTTTTGADASTSASDIDSGSLSGSNIAFLFLQPTAGKDKLCSACAQNILASYIQFETSIPYAIGLSNSDILKGQSDLYKAGKKECGEDWAKKVNAIAGTTDFAKVAGALANHKVSAALVALVAGFLAAGLAM